MYVTIKNIGSQGANKAFKVVLYRMVLPPDGDWELFCEKTIDGLGAGESYTFKCQFEYPPPGCDGWAVHGVVDPDNLIKESNEDNNSLTVEVP